MPLPVRDYSWHETIDQVMISIPLKGVRRDKVDILSTDDYIKVNFPPHFWELFPFASFDSDGSVATIADGSLNFRLQKKEQLNWNKLEAPFSDDKAICKEKRLAALENYSQREEEKRKKFGAEKHELKRFAVQKQLDRDEVDRRRITEIVETTKAEVMEDLDAWEKARKEEEEEERKKAEETRVRRAKMLAAKKEKEERRKREELEGKENEIDGESIFEEAPIRRGGKISVNFTERAFPTPVRESTTDAENEWLKKQAEARKMCDVEDENLRPEEKNPEWLLSKGDTFLRQENFQAAVNAYTHGIRLGGKTPLPNLFSNRAACHLRLRNLHKALEDSSRALELFTPPVPQNAADRKLALSRRGTAFEGLECFVEALVEFEGAFKLDRHDKEIENKIEELRKIIQGNGEETKRQERRDLMRGEGDREKCGAVDENAPSKRSVKVNSEAGDEDDDDDEKEKDLPHFDVDDFQEKQRERRNDLILNDHK